MKIFYGQKKQDKPDSVFLDETDIPIPSGKTFHELPSSILKNIERKRLGDKEIYQLFRYSGLSLWWFIYPTIFATFARTIFFIKNFEDLLKKYKPESIQVIGEFDKIKIIEQICTNYNIPFKHSKLLYLGFLTKRYFKNLIQPMRYKIINRRKVKKRISIFNTNKNKIPDLNGKAVLFLPTSYRRDIYDPEKKKIIRGEYLVEPIINMINKMNLSIGVIDVDYSFHGQPEVLLERLQNQMDWIPTEIIIKTWKPRKLSNSFLREYQQIINDDNFRKLFRYHDIEFWKELEDDFKMLSYEPYLPTYIEMYESFKHFFNIHKPLSILIPYETGPFALSLISACKEKKIKTFGIQHGGLIDKHPDYLHDIFQSPTNPLGMPLVDKLLVFGEYFRKSLMEQAGYAQEKIIVFGNPMYFDIEKILASLDSNNLKKKYKIPENKKIILFTTATAQKYYSQGGLRDYDERILAELSKKFSKEEKYFVIVKPHPTETYLDSYKEIIKNNNCKNFIIIQGNLFELMHISDVVVSFYSTSLIDSILLKKPTIRILFRGMEVANLFTDYGIFLESKLESLSKNIKKVIDDDLFRKNLLKNREKFIHDQFNIPNPDAYEQLKSLLMAK